jgi:hypothetical protein
MILCSLDFLIMRPASILAPVFSVVIMLMALPAEAQVKVNTWSGATFSNFVTGNGGSYTTFTSGAGFETPNFRGGHHFSGDSGVMYHGSSEGAINMYSGGESSSW